MAQVEAPPKSIKLASPQRFEKIPVSAENVFTFPEGVPAFEEYHQFVLYCTPEMQPFFFMKSIGISPEISFVCIDPFLVDPSYEVNIGRAEQKSLGIENQYDAFIFSTVTVSDDPKDITANLQGPMVINLRTSVGKQVICEGNQVRFRLWDALNEIEGQPQAPVDMKKCV